MIANVSSGARAMPLGESKPTAVPTPSDDPTSVDPVVVEKGRQPPPARLVTAHPASCEKPRRTQTQVNRKKENRRRDRKNIGRANVGGRVVKIQSPTTRPF